MILPIKAKQTRLINGCGPASLATILQYYGANISEDELLCQHGGLNKTEVKNFVGTHEIDNATVALRNGFHATAYTANSKALGLSDNYNNQYIPRELLEDRLKVAQNTQGKILERSINAITAGVNLMLIRPSIRTMQAFLQQGTPLHLSVNANTLYGTKKFAPPTGHSIVIAGYDENKFYYADPELDTICEIDNNTLLESVIAHSPYHSAYLVAITKK